MKNVNLNTEILQKCMRFKHGMLWTYLCSKQTPLAISFLANHWKLTHDQVNKALLKLIRINAVEKIDTFNGELYQANPATYFHSN